MSIVHSPARFSAEDVRDASELLCCALSPKLQPTSTNAYGALIAKYQMNVRLQEALNHICEGLSIKVLAVTPTEGVIMGTTRHSPFAHKIADIRPKANNVTQGKLAIGFMAVATALFPTAESIDSDDFQSTPITATKKRVREILLGAVAEIKKRHADGSLDQDLHHIWREIDRMPDLHVHSEDRKRDTYNLKSIEGLIHIVLKLLKDNGLITNPDDGKAFMARDRFRQQLRYMGASNLQLIIQSARPVILEETESMTDPDGEDPMPSAPDDQADETDQD